MVEDVRSLASRLNGPVILSLALALIVGLAVALPVVAQTGNPMTPGIKISEVQTRGDGGAGDEFVEIRNTSTTGSIDISGYKLQGCSSGSGAPTNMLATVPANTTLAANQTYLFASSGFNAVGVTPDQTTSIGITDFASNNASGVRIVDASDAVLDGVGSSGTGTGGATSQCREGTGTLTSTATADVSIERQPPDETNPDAPGVNANDTNNNANDFAPNTPSDPQNSDGGGNGGGGEQPGETEIHDIQGDEQRSEMEGEEVENVEGVITAFRDNGIFIQDDTPDEDNNTSEGIFVFTGSNSNPDRTFDETQRVLVDGTVTEFRPGCDGTSDGCEPSDGGFDNLSITEIVTTISGVTRPALPTTPNGVIEPTIIGAGGRQPPTETIENDTNENVEDPDDNEFDPDPEDATPAPGEGDGIDFFESLEGMFVRVNTPVAVGPSERRGFGEIPVLADNGAASAEDRTLRGGITISPNDEEPGSQEPEDFNPERIIFDDEVLKDNNNTNDPQTQEVNVGDTFPQGLQGVIDYSFGNFKAQLTTAPGQKTPSALAEEQAGEPENNELAVAEYSLENLSPEEDETTFENAANEIVMNLQSPDLIGLTEVQDNDGDTNSEITDANATAQRLIETIEAGGGPTYQYRDVDPQDDMDGGEPGGNIRVGFLFREDRGLEFVDRGNAGPTDATKVKDRRNKPPQLSLSPGRVQPNDPAFLDSRKPLAGEFRYNGQKLFVIQNHFVSKGEDSPLFGRFQPPKLRSEPQRIDQAQVVRDFVNKILAADRNASVIVMGDLNEFEFRRPLNILEGEGRTGLTNLIESVPRNDRYTFVFDGNSQNLDHMLISRGLRDENEGAPADFDIVHTSAEFAERDSDHDPIVGFFDLGGRGGNNNGGNGNQNNCDKIEDPVKKNRCRTERDDRPEAPGNERVG